MGALESKSGQATTGALQALQEQSANLDPNFVSPVAERTTRGVIVGALSQLDNEEQQALLRELIASSAAAAVGGIAAQDQAALGRLADLAAANAIAALSRELEADGPLRANLNSATRQLSASAIAGARDQLRDLVPSCAQNDPNCIERRIVELSRSVSRGVAKGVFDELELGALGLAFLGGVILTLVVMAFVRIARAP